MSDPSLVDKAQAAVKRAAGGVGSVVFGSSVERRREEASDAKASGVSDRNATQGARRQKTGPREKAGGAASSRGQHPPGAGRGEGRGGDESRKEQAGKDHADGRGGDKPGSNGNGHAYGRGGDKPGSNGRGHAYGRGGDTPGSNGRRRNQRADHRGKPSGPSRGGGRRGAGTP